MNNKLPNPFEKIIDQSIEKLNANSKAVECALEKLAQQEGIEISSEEYNEIKYLTDTMAQLDEVILNLINKPKAKPKKRKKKSRRRKRK